MSTPVVHFDSGWRDSEKAHAFYSKLFDWEMQQAGPPAMITTSATGIDRHIHARGHEPHTYVTVYVQVDDLPAYLAKAAGLGGKKIVGPIDIPTGSFAWMADPEGTVIGLFKPKA